MFWFGGPDINKGIEEYRNMPHAVLIDVREADEFRGGHIPGAVNVPLSRVDGIDLPRMTPLFVYCLRGTRSRQAVNALKRMGYDNVKSIGGIASYKGELER